MTEAKHSPLPWKAQENYDATEGIAIVSLRDGGAYENPTNGLVAVVTLFPTEIDADDWSRAKANAAFIVRATSLHHELVAALEETTRHLEDAQSGFIPMSGSDEAWTKKQGEIVTDARAALQKAKQGDKQ